MKFDIQKLRFSILLALGLGLAPFYPQPHIIGKIKWLMGGAKGMTPMDYFDVALHGLPWVYLLVVIAMYLYKRSK